ncbi:lipoprotein insertase outer membrane protein LolB [Lysobacter panacisoli]|uniref:Outer-membrane lipoprotein LolB n=1 Tax=Lysobacter panacisoli TaxID=1255263 RepID=A0ABP9L6P3_9GAMM|nr:lipoprotein insertase outer membrane protein LolB [Lysobacter panacisoli]
MNSLRFLLASAMAAVVLSGCVSQPTRAPAVPVDRAEAERQDRARDAITDWNVTGRIAVSNGSQGGSGRIDWQQTGERYTVALSAPVTRQSWRLIGDASSARLEGVSGGPREGSDAEGLLLETTGWNIPVQALSDWVRGVGAGDGYGPAHIVYGEGNRPVRLEQAGWAIDYEQWQDGAAEPAMPTRLIATRGTAKVRLIVDQWSLDGTR